VKVLLFALACLALGLASAQQPITVRLGAPGAEISPLAITGFNYGLSMQVALYRAEFDALNVRAIRYPPGNDADNYPITTDMMDALKVQWELLNRPELLIVVNFFAGPEHAAFVAEYLQAIGLPVRAWAIGNEPDLYPRNRMDPRWTAEVYCERFRSFAAVLKEIDPDAVVTGPAVSGSRPLGKEYLREVLYLCGDVIDVLTWHVYPTDGTWQDEAALATSQHLSEEIALFKEWLKDPQRNPRGHDREIGLAITEFGLSWRTPNFRHLEDMIAALWLADALGRMATGGLDWGFYFALQAMGGHGLIDRSGWIRPTYYVYAMFADFAGRARTLELSPELPLVTAYAAENEDALRLIFVNRSIEDAAVVLEPELLGELELKTLSDEIFDEALRYRVSVQEASEAILLPARSVVLVRSAQ
jgi:hypothetical protein